MVRSAPFSEGRIDFQILGPTEAHDGDRRVELPTGRGRALLALLLLHAGEPVASDRIVDELWGDDPPRTAGTVVHGLVSRLRRAFDPTRPKGASFELLQTVGLGYRLAVEADAVDANRFKRLLDEARRGPIEERSSKLSLALKLWRGPALADFTYEPFAQAAISALEELRIGAIEDRFEADLADGHDSALVGDLQEQIATHPYRERLRGFLMLALYRSGRQAEALQAYHQARLQIGEDLGLEPGPALRQLEAAIFRQDRSLERISSAPPADPRDTADTSWLPRERRIVTVVAMDVATPTEQPIDPEAASVLGEQAVRVATDAFWRHGGRVERVMGDLLLAFFGFPTAHEDDPVRAVRAALDACSAVHALGGSAPGEKISTARAGIETGEIVVTGPATALRDIVVGNVLTSAGRLEQAADGGEVLIGPVTARLVRGAVIVERVEPRPRGDQPAWRVLDMVTGIGTRPRAVGAPMFGRQKELSRLRSSLRHAVRSTSVVRIIVLGEAGIGKSRLARELVTSSTEDAYALTLRCPAKDEGPFFPLRQAVVEAAGLHGWKGLHDLLGEERSGSRILGELADAIALSADPSHTAVLAKSMQRLVDKIAAERPLVVVLEDLHWAEPAWLDVVDLLATSSRGAILFVCLGRPELLANRPEWDGQATLELGPLSESEVQSLVVEQARSITPDALRPIVQMAGGNPLYAEQLLAALDDSASDDVPHTLRGLLTARLDRLGPGERDVLRCAALTGMEADQDAVSALLPDVARPFVERHLDALQRKRLLEPSRAKTFRFCHALVRLAAYQSMTHADCARLHERFAEWLEHESPNPAAELHELIRYHRVQARAHRQVVAAGT